MSVWRREINKLVNHVSNQTAGASTPRARHGGRASHRRSEGNGIFKAGTWRARLSERSWPTVTMPRNEAPKNTIMKDVPPGDESGIYYIIISGLPFGTIWQLLKDWLRQAGCDVDHIEVFQKSTSGWVRLIGKDNFERALCHLRTVPYNNRLLLYLDKNRSESVKIMELIDDPLPKPKLSGGSHAARSKSKLRSHHKAAHGNKRRPQAAVSPRTYSTTPTASAPTGKVVAAPRHYGTSPEELQRRFTMADAYGQSGWAPPQYAPAYPASYRPMPQAGAAAPVVGEQGLSNCFFLRHDGACGLESSKMASWAGSSALCDTGRRGWHNSQAETESFLDSVAARRAVELLDQKPFLGQLVNARLAGGQGGRGTDQGTPARRSSALQAGPAACQSEDDQRSAAAAPSRNVSSEAAARHDHPVIAHGTCYRPR